MITSLNNEKIKTFLALKDKKVRYQEKRFLIEGLHLVEEAFKTSLLDTIITSDEKIVDQFSNINTIFVNEAIIKKLSSTTSPQPIIGIVKMPSYDDDFKQLIAKKDLKLVMLDDINDPGNLGTIIRTTAALGFDGIIISPNTVDLYNEKVIRATQGVLFKIPIIKKDLKKTIMILKSHQIKCYATALFGNTIAIENLNPASSFAICFGNEARGINTNLMPLMDEVITLPMKKDVESLNVAVASGIIMYELINKK